MLKQRREKRQSPARKQTERIDCLGLGIIPVDILMEVPYYPKAGSKLNAGGMMIQGGGPAPNCMVGLRRLGLRSEVIAPIGDDLPGQITREELRREWLSDRYLVSKNVSSDVAIGFIEQKSGDRTLVLNRGAFVLPRDIVTSRLPLPKVVHLDGRDMPACLKLARWAKKVGAEVSFDIGSMRNDVSAIFPLVDHLVVADAFALPFTKTRSIRTACAALAERCPGTVVVTNGTKGQTALADGEYHRQKAFEVKVVDTTGAGDGFHVGYLYGLIKGEDLPVRMLLGSAVAALNCTKLGARTGLPSQAQLMKFLRGKPKQYA